MISLSTLALFAATEFLLCLSPGPAVLLVLARALGHGLGGALPAILGILSANAFYFALSATGLGALLLASHDLFLVVKWLGAAYLVYLGVSALMARGEGPFAKADRTKLSFRRSFASAFALQAANPKNLLFFVGILPQFVDPHANVAMQMLIFGVTSILIEIVVLTIYAIAAGRAARLAARPRIAVWIDRACGTLLVAAGLRLAAQSQR